METQAQMQIFYDMEHITPIEAVLRKAWAEAKAVEYIQKERPDLAGEAISPMCEWVGIASTLIQAKGFLRLPLHLPKLYDDFIKRLQARGFVHLETLSGPFLLERAFKNNTVLRLWVYNYSFLLQKMVSK